MGKSVKKFIDILRTLVKENPLIAILCVVGSFLLGYSLKPSKSYQLFSIKLFKNNNEQKD